MLDSTDLRPIVQLLGQQVEIQLEQKKILDWISGQLDSIQEMLQATNALLGVQNDGGSSENRGAL